MTSNNCIHSFASLRCGSRPLYKPLCGRVDIPYTVYMLSKVCGRYMSIGRL